MVLLLWLEMGPLVVLEKGRTITENEYIKTLKKHFIPFCRRIVRKYSCDVVMQEDNAPWYTAKEVWTFLEGMGVKYIGSHHNQLIFLQLKTFRAR